MLEYIRNELLGMTDKGEYAAFTSSLIPGCDNIIGIRQPVLKQYAKQLIKENKDFRQLLSEPDIYQEETLVNPETGEVFMEPYKYLTNFIEMPVVLLVFLIGVLAVLWGIVRTVWKPFRITDGA